jgi:cystathionine beta-lyase/cystathionine gamma-synthase
MRLATRLIHHSGVCCEHTGAVSPPIYQVSTFRQDAVGKNKGYDYSRTGNPTRGVLERYIADLETGRHGFAFSSGMAAISGCLMLLKSGNHVIATQGLYGGTYRALTRIFKNLGISCSFVDTGDLDAVEAAFRDNTRAVFVETPSNPTMVITDIGALAEQAHARDALVMVDNTFMSPFLQRPLEHGADIVIHSATKFLGGHSDLIMGLAVTNDEALGRRIHRVQNAVGAVPSPFDCWLLMRGMKTLGVRICQGQATAIGIAEWLSMVPEVERVFYPGADRFPGREGHEQQAEGPGAVLSFTVRDGVCAEILVNSVQVWTLAVSLGAVESIITLPAKMTHLPYARDELKHLGIGDNLVRLSVGLEATDDLIEDLAQALRCAARGG